MQILRYWLATFLIVMACSSGPPATEDEDLNRFMEMFSECAYNQRLFADDKEMLTDELGRLDFPDNWQEMVDSLTATYGGDVYFWSEVFNEIANRARR